MKNKNKTKEQLINELVEIRQKTTEVEISKIYETIFDNATDGILLAGIENKKFYIGNKMICQMLGYSLEEIKNMVVMDIHPEKDLPYVIEQFEKQSRKEIGLAQDVPVKRKDGCIFYADINSFPITLHGKTYLAGIFRDITERKKVEEQLIISLREKEILLRELYHRTKNNLQLISSLLTLQSMTINNKQMLQILKEIQNRINSISLVHEKLYKSKDLSNVNLKDYIKDLANALLMSYEVSKDRISLKFDVDDIFVTVDTVTPFGLIINELLSNSLKYAFPNDRKGEIEIGVRLTDKGEIELQIRDNGIGLPRNLDVRNVKSLGLKLVSQLAEKQLNGKMELKGKKGTHFLITFK